MTNADDKGLRFHPEHAPRGPLPPLHAERLYAALGVERSLDEAARTLRLYVQGERPPAVGAMHLTCSDEAERECVEAFDRNFVRYLLPGLKFSSKAAFRVANLGSRYEWGSVRICEDHFSLARGAEDWKILVVKVNAHVSVEEAPAGRRFGRMERYDSESVYCGALHAVLDGTQEPFAADLVSAFGFEEIDRLAALNDSRRVDPGHRGLFAAVASARLQARRAMLDIQDHIPRTPTLYLVIPSVTLNQRGHDTEILCGVYTADRRGEDDHDEYCGLGDLPWKYRLRSEGNALAIEDEELHRPRRARDHRSLVLAEWRRRERGLVARDAELARELKRADEEGRHRRDHPYAKALLSALLAMMLEVSPIPAAVLLFGQGLVNIHHVHQAHRLAREAEGDEAARAMLAEIQGRIEALDPERARHLVELLLREYR